MARPVKSTRRRRFSPALLLLGALLALVLGGCGSGGSGGGRGHHAAPSGPTALRASGNRLVIGTGTDVQLRGINRAGTEYKCEQGAGIFDSPTPDAPDSPTMVAAMKSWDINVVRVPLNEGCWLGEGTPSQFSGMTYQKAIEAYVHELNQAGLFVILSLQWVEIDGTADYSPPMPDATYAPSFWQSVAGAFKTDPDVLFDLYNEPFQVSWSCWLSGCEVPAGSGGGGGGSPSWPAYTSTGMQELVDAVRGTGARQPLLLGGLDYSLDLSGWLAHEPKDPDDDLVASVHSYGGRSPCDSTCQNTIVSVAAKVPVVFGELGEVDCGTSYIEPLMSFADSHGIGYLGWTWDAVDTGWSCSGGPALIEDYNGQPTAYGTGFEQHFQGLGEPIGTSGSPESAPTPSSTATTATTTTATTTTATTTTATTTTAATVSTAGQTDSTTTQTG